MADTKTITVRKFCGVDIDINDFYKSFPFNEKGKQNHDIYSAFTTPKIEVEFMGFVWVYIGDSSNQQPFINKETKATGTISTDVDDIAFDFLKRSYDTSKFPGIIDQYGKWKNGRTRNSSGKQVNENWMPAAQFKFTALNEKLASISTGSKANSRKHHKTQHPNNLKDYEEQGVAAVEAGLSRTEVALKDWFLEETDFDGDFDTSRFLSLVVNKVLARTANEYALVNQDIDNQKFADDYKISNSKLGGKIALYKAKDGTAGMKYFTDKILSSGGYPPPTILYTDAYSPEECGLMVCAFLDKLQEMHENTFNYVNNKVSSITIDSSVFAKDFILGVIPNLDRGTQKQLLKQGSLVSVEQYIKDSGYKPKKKNTSSQSNANLNSFFGTN
tara:strand:+ start:196 stop:1356 length:1161 start_codon:yes stop_codon:yes gene_type:complete